MKFKYDHRFQGGPYNEVVHFLTEEYIFEPSQLPNVKSNKTLEEKITDEKKYWKNEWCAHGQIPKIVQHLVKPQMLTWIEETSLDRVKKTLTTKITPFYFQNVLRCESKGYFVKVSDAEFIRITEGFLDINVPVFGRIIEELIISHLKGNFDTEYKATYKVIKEKFGK